MKAETKATVLEALRFELSEFEAWIDSTGERERGMKRIKAAIADIESSGATTWEPLADGVYEGSADIDNGRVSESGSITIRGNTVEVYEFCFGHSIEAHTTLPSDIRLCRRTTAQQPAPSVPSDVREAMRNVVDGYWGGNIDGKDFETIEAWLDEQGGD